MPANLSIQKMRRELLMRRWNNLFARASFQKSFKPLVEFFHDPGFNYGSKTEKQPARDNTFVEKKMAGLINFALSRIFHHLYNSFNKEV
jgi:hypothetical protein